MDTDADPTSATRMPAAFLGHGSPMNALEHNGFTEAWADLGAAVPRPRAILAVSAHWYINATAVTAMERPPVIHDFYGFPEALFALDYPAPGSPEVAREVVDVVAPRWVGLDRDSWGIDHGTWSVLVHAFPDADVPVVQLSIDASAPLEQHVELGRALAPLRERGVLIVGSGNVVHNLGRLDPRQPESGFDWTERFDASAREVMATDPGSIGRLVEHADWHAAVPTPEHFLPLAYLAGLADAAGETADVLVGGNVLGSLSMTSWTIGFSPAPDHRADLAPGGGGAGLPDPVVVPPEETNT